MTLLKKDTYDALMKEQNKVIEKAKRKNILRRVFIKRYACLSEKERHELFSKVEYEGRNTPISWSVAHQEVLAKTKFGDKVLDKFVEIELKKSKKKRLRKSELSPTHRNTSKGAGGS